LSARKRKKGEAGKKNHYISREGTEPIRSISQMRAQWSVREEKKLSKMERGHTQNSIEQGLVFRRKREICQAKGSGAGGDSKGMLREIISSPSRGSEGWGEKKIRWDAHRMFDRSEGGAVREILSVQGAAILATRLRRKSDEKNFFSRGLAQGRKGKSRDP